MNLCVILIIAAPTSLVLHLLMKVNFVKCLFVVNLYGGIRTKYGIHGGATYQGFRLEPCLSFRYSFERGFGLQLRCWWVFPNAIWREYSCTVRAERESWVSSVCLYILPQVVEDV